MLPHRFLEWMNGTLDGCSSLREKEITDSLSSYLYGISPKRRKLGVGCEACKIGDNRRNDFFFLSEENSSNDFLQNRAFIYHLFPCTRTRVENRRGEARVLSSSGRN